MQPVKGFIETMTSFSKSGFEIVPVEVQKERLDICRQCDRYQNGICLECLCIMSIKSRIAAAYCPIGYWPAVSGGIPMVSISGSSVPKINLGGCCGKVTSTQSH